MNFKCFFGIHIWRYSHDVKKRICLRCGEKQEQCYDMTYGESYWQAVYRFNIEKEKLK